MRKEDVDYLYHYTKVETLLKYILPQNAIRLNSLINMNDPNENLLHMVYKDGIINTSDPSLDEVYSAEKIQKESKVACFSIKSGQKSGYSIQPMWAHYAENNCGVCIEIDFSKLLDSNSSLIKRSNFHYGKIEYNDIVNKQLPTPLYGTAIGNIEIHQSSFESYTEALNKPKFIEERFFTKNTDWQYEKEYRFLALDTENNEVFLNLKDAIKRIILGPNFSQDLLPALEAQITKDKISYVEIDLNGDF